MKRYQYQILRYIHDRFTGEYVNVGVVVYQEEDGFLGIRTTNKYHRITSLFPGADGRWVTHSLKYIEARVKSIASELKTLFQSSKDLSHITASIIPNDNNALEWTEAKYGLDIDPKIALEDIFHNQVEKYIVQKGDTGSRTDEEIWKEKYKKHFEKCGIINRLKPHKVSVPNDELAFNFSWKNERWHSYEPLSFVLKKKESVREKVYKWAGKLQALNQSNENFHLTLLTSLPPKHNDLKEFIEEYLKVDSDRLKVDIVSDKEAKKIALQIKREMELHDSHE